MRVAALGTMIGASFVVAWFIKYHHQRDWRKFESRYIARDLPQPLASKMTGTARIARPGDVIGLPTKRNTPIVLPPVTVGTFPGGISLSIVWPFRYGCRELYLPFRDMEIHKARIGLVGDCYGLRMRGMEHHEIVLFGDVMRWVGERSPSLQIKLAGAKPRTEGI